MRENPSADLSVIIPYYNSYRTIERALKSVIHQTFTPREVIIIDDASEGKKNKIVLKKIKASYSKYIKILIFRLEKNQGVSDARNFGWEKASGKYIAFLDSDDLWHPKKVEIQYNFMSEFPGFVMSGHAVSFNTGQKNNFFLDLDSSCFTFIDKWKLIFSNPFTPSSFMLKKDIKERFAPGQRHMEDHRLCVDLVYKYNRIPIFSAALAFSFKSPYGESGLSGQLGKMEKADLSNLNYFKMRGYINQFQYLYLYLFSLIRFLRRIVITFFRFS